MMMHARVHRLGIPSDRALYTMKTDLARKIKDYSFEDYLWICAAASLSTSSKTRFRPEILFSCLVQTEVNKQNCSARMQEENVCFFFPRPFILTVECTVIHENGYSNTYHRLFLWIYYICQTKLFEISLTLWWNTIGVIVFVKFEIDVKTYIEITRYLLQVYASQKLPK